MKHTHERRGCAIDFCLFGCKLEMWWKERERQRMCCLWRTTRTHSRLSSSLLCIYCVSEYNDDDDDDKDNNNNNNKIIDRLLWITLLYHCHCLHTHTHTHFFFIFFIFFTFVGMDFIFFFMHFFPIFVLFVCIIQCICGGRISFLYWVSNIKKWKKKCMCMCMCVCMYVGSGGDI